MKRPKMGRAGRKPPDRYTTAELQSMCVDDVLKGVHTTHGATKALGWFAEACALIGKRRAIGTDAAFLDVMHDAVEKQGHPIL